MEVVCDLAGGGIEYSQRCIPPLQWSIFEKKTGSRNDI